MNVDPVQAVSAVIERQTRERNVHVAPPLPDGAPGDAPDPEIAQAQSPPVPPVIPEHDVRVQLDTSSNVVIYQILDKQSSALVLQVPSAQQVRNIEQTQELLQRIAARSKPSL
jgi:hypothetical protein